MLMLPGTDNLIFKNILAKKVAIIPQITAIKAENIIMK
jgi:hypothetical protein